MLSEVLSQIQKSAKTKIYSMMALLILADFLFYKQAIGWAAGLFGIVMVGFYFLHNQAISKSLWAQIITILTICQCLILIEKSSAMSLCLMVLGLMSLSLLRRDDWKNNAALWLAYCLLFFAGFLYPLRRLNNALKKYQRRYVLPNTAVVFVRGWFLPIVFSCLFLFLFSQANPIIQNWFKDFDARWVFRGFTLWRVIFWLVMAGLVCSVIRPCLKIRSKRKKQQAIYKKQEEKSFTKWAFTKEAIIRSLVIFNLIFAVQTIMDMDYLWLGRALPEGFSYAEYAHDGAYPLIVTALLAALFVLITQSSDKEISESTLIKKLTYIWVAQNILLVFSSIYRTALYVEIYALTYLRFAAFMWMGLVAAGLIWIILRSVWQKSNTWLINANVITLLATLYITSFINIGGDIAHYNVLHSKEMKGTGVSLDFGYLEQIGGASIPSLEKLQKKGDMQAISVINQIAKNLKHNMDDWRQWTYSEYRLLKYLQDRKHENPHEGWVLGQD